MGNLCSRLTFFSDFDDNLSFDDILFPPTLGPSSTVAPGETPRLDITRFRTLPRHSGAVTAVAFSPDGQHLATADTCHLRIWNPATGECEVGPLPGQCGLIYAIAWSPNGSEIATGGADGTIRVWSLHPAAEGGGAGGAGMEPLPGHTKWVTSVAWSPCGDTLASGSEDCTLRLWSRLPATGAAGAAGGWAAHGAPLRHGAIVSSVGFSPDGRAVVSASGHRSGDCARLFQKVRLWSAASARPIRAAPGPEPSSPADAGTDSAVAAADPSAAGPRRWRGGAYQPLPDGSGVGDDERDAEECSDAACGLQHWGPALLLRAGPPGSAPGPGGGRLIRWLRASVTATATARKLSSPPLTGPVTSVAFGRLAAAADASGGEGGGGGRGRGGALVAAWTQDEDVLVGLPFPFCVAAGEAERGGGGGGAAVAAAAAGRGGGVGEGEWRTALPVMAWQSHSMPVLAAAFCPAGRLLASAVALPPRTPPH
jgi:hypothetical protein